MQVYLVGPITGKSRKQIADWRLSVRQLCPGIEFVDPALAPFDATKAYLKHETSSQALERLNHGRLVLDRNKLLIKNSDLVLANFLGADRASIGSIGELFWANAFSKPIIVVRERTGNVHDHAMLNSIASRVCFSLEEGCEAVRAILGQSLRIA
jgi:hypothetical protein